MTSMRLSFDQSKMEDIYTWKGVRLEKLSKDELINVIKELDQMIKQARSRHKDTLTLLGTMNDIHGR